MPRQMVQDPKAIRWWIAAFFIAFTMIFGGGARADVMSHIWVRPVAVLALTYAAVTLPRNTLRAHPFLIGMAVAIAMLTALHLVPLPPSLWRSLPNRELIADIDVAVGLGPIWRPLSVAPTTTWNALFSLSVPLAVLLLLLPMDKGELRKMLKVVICIITLSAFIGLAQATGAPLNFYDISNPNAGLFANRNHQAVLLACLYPMLAVFVSEPSLQRLEYRIRWVIALAVGLTLLPLLMVTGSRAGIAAAILGIVSIPFVVPIAWRRDRSRAWRNALLVLIAGLVVIAGLGWIAFENDRNFALLRFTELQAMEDMRFPVWSMTWELAGQYLPWGSGIGSFQEVFAIHEPDTFLGPRYWNHAHNDWLEVALTAGLPGILLLAFGVGGFVTAVGRAFINGKWRGRSNALAKLGFVVIVILGLASIFDYPLRTPAVACVFVFAAVLAARIDDRPAPANT